jgi:hypothetical protein
VPSCAPIRWCAQCVHDRIFRLGLTAKMAANYLI